MTELTLDISSDVIVPLEMEAERLHLTVPQYVVAALREKLKIPVRIGDLEVFSPVNISDYEWRKVDGETEEDFERAKRTYDKLFGSAVRK